MKVSALRVLVMCSVLLWAACSGNGDAGDIADTLEARLSGAIEKGPFVLGSGVTLSPVDDAGNPTGQVFNAQTNNDRGEFDLTIRYQGRAILEGNGFYYNEVTGGLSLAPIDLRAFASIANGGSQQAFINIITHLSFDRVKALLGAGGFSAAIEQAEQELRSALAIGPPQGLPIEGVGTSLSMQGGDTLDNAYLLAVSAVLAQAAKIRAGADDGIDAALQELINGISLNLAQAGTLDAATVELLHQAQIDLDTADVMAKLAARFARIGSDAPVPDIDRVLDQDFDTVVNASDNCPRVANPGQEDRDNDGIGDACDLCYDDTCSGHGQCDNSDGSCDCNDTYAGDACDQCAPGFAGYPDCSDDPCVPDPCNGHGQCNSADGTCACNTGFTGEICNACDEGYIAYPHCVREQEFGVVWVALPGGSFDMGCVEGDGKCLPAEEPVHSVTLGGFDIMAHEVTQAQYALLTDSRPSRHADCDQCPVDSVTWPEARGFCRMLGADLPSEAQWAYAARRESTDIYICGPSDSCLNTVAWWQGNADNSNPVGTLAPTADGIFDLSGNVWEWALDCWHDTMDNAPADGTAWDLDVCDDEKRLLKGGAWDSNNNDIRVSKRRWGLANGAYLNTGFRCARETP